MATTAHRGLTSHLSDDVELLVEHVRQVMDVRADEGRRNGEVAGQHAGGRNRLVAEVRAGHLRTQPRPGQRVEPEVALEMEERPVTDVAHLVPLVVGQPDGPCAVPNDDTS